MNSALRISLRCAIVASLVSHSLLASEETAWDLMILDGAPPVTSLGSLAVADVNGDGKIEIVTGGTGGLLWYTPKTFDKGIIAEGNFHVSAALMDIDGNGLKELAVGEQDPATQGWMVTIYYPTKDLHQPWTRKVVDPKSLAGPHDIVFVDLDKDGDMDMVANATYGPVWGVFAYEQNNGKWKKHTVQTGYAEEGLAIADMNGDGRVDIVSGPDLYLCPDKGPFSGNQWQRLVFAPNFREMSRVAVVDVNGDGRQDIAITESEYPDGISSWYENRMKQGEEWKEHRLFHDLNFAHSLGAWRENDKVRIFVAEMMKGGWDAPYNFDARLLEFTSSDNGGTWKHELLYKGAGTHQATEYDIDGDGQYEIVGKEWGQKYTIPKVQIWSRREQKFSFRHRLLDRDKAYTGTDILASDVDADGRKDVICAAWWYQNGSWQKFAFPNAYQVHLAYDIDGDGRDDYIASKEFQTDSENWYQHLSGDFFWLKAVDPVNGKWEAYNIGVGSGGWAHGVGIGPYLSGGKTAFIATYHGGGSPLFKVNDSFKPSLDAKQVDAGLRDTFKQSGFPLSAEIEVTSYRENQWAIIDNTKVARYRIDVSGSNLEVRGEYPEIFEAPANPKSGEWPKRTLAPIDYGEEFLNYDLNNDGQLDIVAGPYWLENNGDGTFLAHRLIADDLNFQVARVRVVDINNDKLPDLVAVEEDLSYAVGEAFFARVAWFENPGTTNGHPWRMHVFDKLRSPHSLDFMDFDGDSAPELVVGEHDPFKAYRSRSRLFLYQKADSQGTAWHRQLIDGRFEHHCGSQIFELEPGKYAIMSHGWKDSRYVSIWEVEKR